MNNCVERRDLLRALAIGGTALALPGCNALVPLGALPKNRLKIATAREIARLGVSGGGGSETSNVAMLIFDSLVTMNEQLTVVSRLATTWARTSETDWSFTLQPDVRFSNGEACDAQAVATSIERLVGMSPSYSYRNQWGEAWPPTAKALDSQTVVISTPVANAAVPRLMCRIAIIPPIASQSPDFANKPIGSGPYKLRSWSRGGLITLDVNEHYFAGRPPIDRLEWVSIPNAAARVVALRSRDVDLIWDVPYEREQLIEHDPALKVLDYQSIGLAFVTFNYRAKQSPVANPLVRQALTYGIDAQQIRDTLMNGKGEITRCAAPSQVIGSVDAGGYPSRDVAKAKRLLAKAGYPDGLDLVLIFETGNFQHEEDVCSAIVAQLDECGVRIRFDELPPGGMNERRRKTDWDIAPNSVPGSFTGEASYHYYQLKTQQGFHSAPVEALLDQMAGLEGAPRIALLQQAMREMWAETPYLWSLSIARSFGAMKDLHGIRYVPINWLNFGNATIASEPNKLGRLS